MNADGTIKLWRAKAEEARQRARQMKDAAAKKIMLQVAEAYEALATRTVARKTERDSK
jgi:hypothetical protein